MTIRRRFTAAFGGIVALAILLPVMVQAAGPEPTLVINAPAEATLGEAVSVEATLLAPDGSPVAGQPIQFFSPTTFTSVTERMLLGQATTDAAGVASLEYEFRRNEEVQVIARYGGDSQYAPVEASAAVMVQGSTQLYQEKAGIRVPGLNVSLLVGILGLVWSVYFFVFTLVLRIARAGGRVEAMGE